jgi:hypothetical protein
MDIAPGRFGTSISTVNDAADKTEVVVAVMQFGKAYKVGQARQRKGPIKSKRQTITPH